MVSASFFALSFCREHEELSDRVSADSFEENLLFSGIVSLVAVTLHSLWRESKDFK